MSINDVVQIIISYHKTSIKTWYFSIGNATYLLILTIKLKYCFKAPSQKKEILLKIEESKEPKQLNDTFVFHFKAPCQKTKVILKIEESIQQQNNN